MQKWSDRFEFTLWLCKDGRDLQIRLIAEMAPKEVSQEDSKEEGTEAHQETPLFVITNPEAFGKFLYTEFFEACRLCLMDSRKRLSTAQKVRLANTLSLKPMGLGGFERLLGKKNLSLENYCKP